MSSMLNGGNSMLPSAHSDVLLAPQPTEPSSVTSLVEEIKRRGRGEVQGGNYLDAERLYSKAIDVLTEAASKDENDKDLALLYGNRSMVLFKMGKYEKSLKDAQASAKMDSSYVKAYYREGQAYAGMEQYSLAIEAYERGLKVEPSNKVLKKEVQTAKTKQEKAKTKPPAKKTTEEAKPLPTTTKSTKKPSSKNKNETKVSESGEDVKFTASDAIRGYKVLADGTKTSYFHQEVSEEAKKLIGDIAPKRIDPATAPAPTTDTTTKPDAGSASAWNQSAGTWEDRDVSAWSKDTLQSTLLEKTKKVKCTNTPIPAPDGGYYTVQLSKIQDLEGHASIATVRMKKRYVYEFSFTTAWEVVHHVMEGDDGDVVLKGTLKFPDVDGTADPEEMFEVDDCKVQDDCGGVLDGKNKAYIMDKFIKKDGLRGEVSKAVFVWVDLFKKTHGL